VAAAVSTSVAPSSEQTRMPASGATRSRRSTAAMASRVFPARCGRRWR
jgi:hypothetical protein